MTRLRPSFARVALAICAIAAAVALSAPWAQAAPVKATLVGSASYQDLDTVKAGTASFDLTFPLGNHFAIGPVVEYTYAKIKAEFDEADPSTAPVTTLEGMEQPPATITYSGGDDTLSVLSAGLRLALFVQKSHNGFGFSLEGIWPQHDAEGVVVTPGAFFEAGIGSKGVFRTEYQHPLHYNQGEAIDLEGWRLSAGFGRRW